MRTKPGRLVALAIGAVLAMLSGANYEMVAAIEFGLLAIMPVDD
jgi:hypothetical protein